MTKNYSELIGMPVIDSDGNVIAVVKDLIIDPEQGNILGFLLRRDLVITPMDVVKLGTHSLTIHHADSLTQADEILRIAEVRKSGKVIFGASVFGKESGKYLGRVFDFTIDSTVMKLKSISVGKLFLVFQYDEKIIDARKIVQIKKDAIYVNDAEKVVKKEEAVAASSLYAS